MQGRTTGPHQRTRCPRTRRCILRSCSWRSTRDTSTGILMSPGSASTLLASGRLRARARVPPPSLHLAPSPSLAPSPPRPRSAATTSSQGMWSVACIYNDHVTKMSFLCYSARQRLLQTRQLPASAQALPARRRQDGYVLRGSGFVARGSYIPVRSQSSTRWVRVIGEGFLYTCV